MPIQKALASFLAKRGNAGMVVPFQIPRMKLGSLPDLPGLPDLPEGGV
ncbi:hypothetical protein [Alteromonas sp. 07-89-2]|nr:hypothetical protein [Alteromonas sp. 07-89-2]